MPSFCSLTTKGISRKSGSTTSAVAYITGQKIKDERQNRTFDYGKRGRDIVKAQTYLPTGAPAEWNDNAKLWNAVEATATTKDARVGIRQRISCPNTMSHGNFINGIEDYIKKNFTDRGIVATAAWHDNDTHTNFHVHIIAANRAIDPETGEWQKVKSKRVYDLDENGNKKPIYEVERDDKGKLIKDEKGNPVLKRDENGKPIQKIEEKTGRKCWQRKYESRFFLEEKDFPMKCRELWCECANQYLEEKQHLDPRSYEKQGLAQQPLKNYSRKAWYQEKRAERDEAAEIKLAKEENRQPVPVRHTEIYYKNLEIKSENLEIKQSNREYKQGKAFENALSDNISFLQGLKVRLESSITKIVKSIGGFIHRNESGNQQLERAKNAIREQNIVTMEKEPTFKDLHHIPLQFDETEKYIVETDADIIENSITAYDISAWYNYNSKDEKGNYLSDKKVERYSKPIYTQQYGNIDELLTTKFFEGTSKYYELTSEYAFKQLSKDIESLEEKKSPEQASKQKQGEEHDPPARNYIIQPPKKPHRDEPSL